MKTIYLLARKYVTHILIITTVAWLAPVLASDGRVLGASDEANFQQETLADKEDKRLDRADADVFSIGPGRVVFQFSPVGKWLGWLPDWRSGENVITGGGVVVLATDEDGRVVELANTASGGLTVDPRTAEVATAHEGIDGGARYPAKNRDDDGDGSEDEDRLDRVDNDGDGFIDEDYAAVGDEMIVLGYHASASDGRPVLDIHQECYAWSMPHVDGMTAVKLSVRNVSRSPLRDVRIGASLSQQGDWSVAAQDLESPDSDGSQRLVSKGILASESAGTAVAVLFFAVPGVESGDGSWLTGVAANDRRLKDLLSTAIHAGDGNKRGGTAAAENLDASKSSAPVAGVTAKGSERKIYGISPNLGDLEPGEELVVYMALLAVQSVERADRAIDDAYRTVVGDGTHRMIPPPMSVICRMVWGTYELRGTNDAPGVTITLENPRGQGITATDISYLTGVNLRTAVIAETFSGDVEIVSTDPPSETFTDAEGRVTLHGRLKGGEFFDVALSPAGGGGHPERPSELNADDYWTQPGKLDEACLTGSPNPFREVTTIFYEVPASADDEEGGLLRFVNPVNTSVKVYNVAGRLVNVLVDAVLPPGVYDTQWDGMDDAGTGVASGVYYVKLQIGKRHVTKRLIQLK